MSRAMLDEHEAREVVDNYMSKGIKDADVQDILNSGAVPALKDLRVQSGKVADSIYGPSLVTSDGIPLRVMFGSSRISTKDEVRGSVPLKDQTSALVHHRMMRLVEPIMGASEYQIPGLNGSPVRVAENLDLIPLEMVVRAYMALTDTDTSLYHHYVNLGKRVFCGHQMPEGLIANGKIPFIIDTPSTKAKKDKSMSAADMIAAGFYTQEQYDEIKTMAFEGFEAATAYYTGKGFILVDTKTEHGINHRGDIVLADEAYTLDASRVWEIENYEGELTKLEAGEIDELKPTSYSKQFARDMKLGPDGMFSQEQLAQIAVRYIIATQEVMGEPFVPDERPREEIIIEGLEQVVDHFALE